VDRAKRYGIRHFATIAGIPGSQQHQGLHAVIDRMEEYVNRPTVVGSGDRVRPDHGRGGGNLRPPAPVREERKLPVLIHTPHQNKKVGQSGP